MTDGQAHPLMLYGTYMLVGMIRFHESNFYCQFITILSTFILCLDINHVTTCPMRVVDIIHPFDCWWCLASFLSPVNYLKRALWGRCQFLEMGSWLPLDDFNSRIAIGSGMLCYVMLRYVTLRHVTSCYVMLWVCHQKCLAGPGISISSQNCQVY